MFGNGEGNSAGEELTQGEKKRYCSFVEYAQKARGREESSEHNDEKNK